MFKKKETFLSMTYSAESNCFIQIVNTCCIILANTKANKKLTKNLEAIVLLANNGKHFTAFSDNKEATAAHVPQVCHHHILPAKTHLAYRQT